MTSRVEMALPSLPHGAARSSMRRAAVHAAGLSITGIALTVALAGCSFLATPPKPTVQNLSGKWVNGAASIDLSKNGTFTMTDVPDYTSFLTSQDWRKGDKPTHNQTGIWTIESDAVGITANGDGDKLFFANDGSERILEFGLQLGSDDPRCFEFVKVGSHHKPLRPKNCYIQP